MTDHNEISIFLFSWRFAAGGYDYFRSAVKPGGPLVMCERNYDTPCLLGCLSYYSLVKGGVFASGWWVCASCEYVALPEGPGWRAPLSLSQVPGRRAQLGLNIPLRHARLPTATQWDTWRLGSLLVLVVLPPCPPALCSCGGSGVWGPLASTASLELLPSHRTELRAPFFLKYCQRSVWICTYNPYMALLRYTCMFSIQFFCIMQIKKHWYSLFPYNIHYHFWFPKPISIDTDIYCGGINTLWLICVVVSCLK